jgi:hypothetical protein
VLLGEGNGAFTTPASGNPWGVVPLSAPDVDRDGNLDLVGQDGSVSLGDGAGNFDRPFAYVDGGMPVDVDGDGMIDLLNGWQFARQQGCFASSAHRRADR